MGESHYRLRVSSFVTCPLGFRKTLKIQTEGPQVGKYNEVVGREKMKTGFEN